MKNLLYLALIFFIVTTGCKKDELLTNGTDILQQVSVGDNNAFCTPLNAGQTIDAGTVCLTVVGDDLCITYTTTNGWELVETHLWLGESLSDMPQTKKGNPKIGNFPYASGDITGATTYSFCVPITDLGGEPYVCDKTFFIAAHAAVRKDNGDGTYQTETGWGDGDRIIERGSWAEYFGVVLSCGSTDPPEPKQCETAFAFGAADATCFIGADFDGDGADDGIGRWGWSNGPLAAGQYTWDIYAGAGQCDLNKGTLVGTLTVDYDGSEATVTFNASGTFTWDETHLYVGSDPLASNNGEYTVAPGQYPDQHDLDDATSDSYTVTGLSGNIYIVAHAVSCGDFGS